MKTKKRFISLILCFVLLAGALSCVQISAATEKTVDGFRFNLYDGYARVKGLVDSSGTVIPAEVDGLPVTGIEQRAFYKNTALQEITIPDSVTFFGNSAFRECTNLKKVIYSGIPEMIENEAFFGTGLSTLPENVDEYGNVYASNILVEIGADKKGVSRVRAGTVAVAGDVLAPHYEYEDFLEVKELYFPDGFAYVAPGFAMENSYLEKVVFGKGELYIDEWSFNGCFSLKSVTLPDDIRGVGEYCFEMTAYADNSKNWKNGALYAGKALLLVDITAKRSHISVKNGTTVLAAGAFSHQGKTYTVSLPETVRWIGKNCFFSSGLVSINLPESVSFIGDGAFSSCRNLLAIELPDGLERIGNRMFEVCTKLRSVEIPASVKEIGNGAFTEQLFVKFYGTEEQWLAIKVGKNNVLENCNGVLEYKQTCKHPQVQDFVMRDSTATAVGRISRLCLYCGRVISTRDLAKRVKVENVFRDVKTKHWFYSAIDYAYNYKAFNGTSANAFSPNANMTRGMFVTVLMRLSGNDFDNNLPTGFTDVPRGKYYSGAVRWAAQAGIVNGTGNGKFEPNAPITREQLCKMILLYTAYSGTQVYTGQKAYYFADDSKISSWAWDYVYMCQATGLVQGKSGNLFDPQGLATRAEVATLLHNLHSKYMLLK